MKKNIIIAVIAVLLLTGVVTIIVGFALPQQVDIYSETFYSDCEKQADAEQLKQLELLYNDDGIVYQRAALEIIGQIEKTAPRLNRDKAFELIEKLSGNELCSACNQIAGAPDSYRNGSGIDVLIYNFDEDATERLVVYNGFGFVERKNANGEYDRVDGEGAIEPEPTIGK